MTIQEKTLTLADFLKIATQPENNDKDFEFIDGEIIDVSPSTTRVSFIRDIITVAAHNFCRENSIPCYTSGEAGAYRIGDDVVVPDFAYKRRTVSDDYPDPIVPEWVVEVISPTDKPYEIRNKRAIYIKAGILYWEVYPKSNRVDVYAPGQPLRTFGLDDILDAGDVLPGFKLPVKEIFA